MKDGHLKKWLHCATRLETRHRILVAVKSVCSKTASLKEQSRVNTLDKINVLYALLSFPLSSGANTFTVPQPTIRPKAAPSRNCCTFTFFGSVHDEEGGNAFILRQLYNNNPRPLAVCHRLSIHSIKFTCYQVTENMTRLFSLALVSNLSLSSLQEMISATLHCGYKIVPSLLLAVWFSTALHNNIR